MLVDILNSKSQLISWRFLGILSSIVGLVCYALSSSFKQLFGEWKFYKFLLYIMISLIICGVFLFAKKIEVLNGVWVKAHVGFLVLMLTSLYSFFYDKAVKGNPDALSIISYAAFALTSLCFSRKMELGFEVGFFYFFLGFLTVQLMKIHLILVVLAAVFSYSLIIVRSYSDSQVHAEENPELTEQDNVSSEIQSDPQSPQLRRHGEMEPEDEVNYRPLVHRFNVARLFPATGFGTALVAVGVSFFAPCTSTILSISSWRQNIRRGMGFLTSLQIPFLHRGPSEPVTIWQKRLTRSDINNRLAVAIRTLDYLPLFEGGANSVQLRVTVKHEDEFRAHVFHCVVRRTGYKKPVIEAEWTQILQEKELREGDLLIFNRDDDGEYGVSEEDNIAGL